MFFHCVLTKSFRVYMVNCKYLEPCSEQHIICTSHSKGLFNTVFGYFIVQIKSGLVAKFNFEDYLLKVIILNSAHKLNFHFRPWFEHHARLYATNYKISL